MTQMTDCHGTREKVMSMLRRYRPGLIILGPSCSCFSAIQWFYNYDHCSVASARAKIGEGMVHLPSQYDYAANS